MPDKEQNSSTYHGEKGLGKIPSAEQAEEFVAQEPPEKEPAESASKTSKKDRGS